MNEFDSPLYRITEPNSYWRDSAACKNADVNIFMSREKKEIQEALALCAGCLVVKDCLKFAVDNNISHGIWGGTTERQRKLLKRKESLEAKISVRKNINTI